MAKPEKPKSRLHWTPLLWLVTAVMVAGVGLWGFVLMRRHQAAGEVRVPPAPTVNQAAVGRATPAYARALTREQIADARRAAREGRSYAPPPQVNTVPISLSAINPATPPPAQASSLTGPAGSDSGAVTPAPIALGNGQNTAEVEVSGVSPRGRDAKRDAAALSYLAARMVARPASTEVYAEPVVAASSRGGAPDRGGKPAAASRDALPAALVSVLRPGAMLYAENDLFLDSDSPGPVEATILSGALTGARALGTMSKTGNYLTLRFTSITTRAGVSYDISAYGVDPKIPATTVRSAVDRHLLSRWGGLLAASFLQGYGQAISQSGSTVSSSFGTTTTAMPPLSARQQLEVAAGTVGTQLATVMQQNFNRPNTVTLQPGVPMAILIIKG